MKYKTRKVKVKDLKIGDYVLFSNEPEKVIKVSYMGESKITAAYYLVTYKGKNSSISHIPYQWNGTIGKIIKAQADLLRIIN